jgi:hypothetical protein
LEQLAAAKAKKEATEKEALLMNALYKSVIEQKVPVGVDPKSVLCTYFKKGQCTKGSVFQMPCVSLTYFRGQV